MEPVPALRAGLTLEPAPDRPRLPFVVTDALLERRIRLDALAAAIAASLVEPMPLAALAAAVERDEETTREAVQRLARLHLLDTEATRQVVDEALATQEVLAAPREEVPLLIREDSRFTCSMCGSCCTGQNLGPVKQDILDGLAPHTAMLQDKTGSDRLFQSITRETAATVEEHVLCHVREGGCVFLTDDRKCLIHRELGPEAKPRVCRLFPYRFVATPRGISVSLQMECRGFVEAGRGRPIAEDEPYLRYLLGIVPTHPKVDPVLNLDARQTMSYAAYELLEERLHEAVDAHADEPAAALVAMARLLAEAAGEDVVEAADADPEALAADLEGFVGTMARSVMEVHGQLPDEVQGMVVHAESLEQLIDALVGLRTDLHRILEPADRRDRRELFARKMHEDLMGKRLTQAPTVIQGFARLVLEWLLACGLAIERARQVKRRHLYAQDLVDGLVLMNYLFRHGDVHTILRGLAAPLVDLLHRRLPALVGHADALRDRDPRSHFFKF